MPNRPGRASLALALSVGAGSTLASTACADLLALRDGTRRAGALRACVGASCNLSGDSVPREAIAWIAFGDLTTPPPEATQAAFDEVHLAGGAIVASPVVGISLGVVATESGSVDRAEVSWVRFAGPGGAPSREPVALRGTPTPAPTATPRPPPPPTPAPAPLPPTRSDPATGERGALWTGTIVGRNFGTVNDTFSEWRYSLDVRLREDRYPLRCTVTDANGRPTAVPCGTHARFLSEGSRLRNVFSSTSPYGNCSGQGEITVTDETGRDAPVSGGTWHKSADRDFGAVIGVDIPAGGTLYLVGIGGEGPDGFEISCSNGASWRSGFVAPVLGWLPSYGAAECSDREVRLVEGGGVLRGSHSGPCTGCCPRTEVSWSICREGVACPPPPPLPAADAPPGEPRRPCDETAPDRAQLDLKLDQWRSYAAELQRLAAEVARIRGQADQWSGDFEHAMRDCNLWDVAQILIGLGTAGLAPGQPTGFTAFVNFAGQVEKIASGSPSWLLPTNAVGNEWIPIENLWDIYSFGANNLGGAEPQRLRDRLQACGAPTLDAVLDGAYAYLRLLEELGPIADRMNEQKNRLRDKEEDILDFCAREPRACEDYEACRDGGG